MYEWVGVLVYVGVCVCVFVCNTYTVFAVAVAWLIKLK